jgi:uncharacterized protein YfaP (DUF2135 family)
MITAKSGLLDRDVTTGRGPETYSIRNAAPGKYKVDVHYCSGSQPTTATIKVYRNRGGDNETVREYSVSLQNHGERKTVTEMEVSAKP